MQEAKHKQEALGKHGYWHLIGHLQTNKARQAVALFDLIESVDSEHLLAAIDKEAERIGKVQDILLQLNIAHEEQKSGLDKEDYLALLPKLPEYKHVRLRGLMVIAPEMRRYRADKTCICGRLPCVRPLKAAVSAGRYSVYGYEQ